MKIDSDEFLSFVVLFLGFIFVTMLFAIAWDTQTSNMAQKNTLEMMKICVENKMEWVDNNCVVQKQGNF